MEGKKTMTTMRKNGLWLMLLMLICIVFCVPPSIVAAGEFKVPKTLTVMTYELGTSGYMSYGYIGEYTIKKYETKLRAIPAGNDMGRMIALRAGTTQFAGQGFDVYYAMEGTTPRYSQREWGPQHDLRIVWMARHAGQALVVRGNSDIRSISDLKGRKLAWIPGSTLNQCAEGHLAYAGLTWDDVKKVNMPGYMPSVKAVIAGTIDSAVVMVTTGALYELEASPYGIRFLPESEEEGWKRIRQKLPNLVPYKAMHGAGISESKPLDCASYAYPATVCYENLDDDLSYFMTRAIHEGYDMMGAASEMMKRYWRLDDFIQLYEYYDFAILHPGTVKYLKEIGKWKPAYDKFQRARTEYYRKLRALWDEVGDEAIEKKIKNKDFPDFWLKKRTEFLGKK